jgi:predicted Zn finger-like uncharacterized protein
MSAVRRRRLGADHEKLLDYVRRHARVRLVQAVGEPPEHYQLEYRIRSLRMVHEELQTVETHLVEIKLPLNYPRLPPQCRMLSPVFHPNIAPHAICVGDHWSAGESLQSIVARIGEMLAYQSYNVKSPLNGEAARWVEGNKDKLPLDTVSMLVEESQREQPAKPRPTTTAASTAPIPSPIPSPTVAARATTSTTPSVPPSAPPAPKPQVASATVISAGENASIACPSCEAKYRASAQILGKRVRCTRCQKQFEVPSSLGTS